MKKCCTCQEWKTEGSFSRNKTKSDGLAQACKACDKKHHAKQREKGVTRWYDMKKKFGITKQEYLEMLDKQDHKCAICGKEHSEEKNKRLFVDHCHDTEEVRGLLCASCNLGLGHFKDCETNLAKAIEYLKEHRNG